jgi:hypothetical protein
MNLIQTLGADYMSEFCAGAFFFKDDQLLKFMRARREFVEVYNIDRETEDTVPVEFFTGWSVFRAEPSGYRRMGEHVVAYCTRANSTRRGVRSDTVRMAFTPATMQLSRLVNGNLPMVDGNTKIRSFMRPTYDNLEESLPKLLSGEQLSVVLNENLVIEVAVGGRADAWYNILNKTNVIGKLNRQGRVTWNDPEQSILIPNLQAA